jgi:hypothetical protein
VGHIDIVWLFRGEGDIDTTGSLRGTLTIR